MPEKNVTKNIQAQKLKFGHVGKLKNWHRDTPLMILTAKENQNVESSKLSGTNAHRVALLE